MSWNDGRRVSSGQLRRCAVARSGLATLHRVRRSWVLALSLTVAVVGLSCASAQAALQRGHSFSSSFGGQGGGEGQFEDPTGVAVDESSGEVYVVDSKDERVETFRPSGNGEYKFASQFKVRSPGAIAVDNSNNAADPSRGDVYVVGAEEKGAAAEERNVVYEYSPSEEVVVHKWTKFKSKEAGQEEELELEDITGVAVDANGTLWVYWEEEGVIDGFSKQRTKSEATKLEWEPLLRRTPEVESKFECSARSAFAVAPGDEFFYAGYERETSSESCPGEQEEPPNVAVVAKLDGAAPLPRVVSRELDREDSTGAAVDEASAADTPLGETAKGDVYLDNGNSVAAFATNGLLIQRFGLVQLTSGSGLAVDSATGDVLVADSAKDLVDVFTPEEGAEAPVIDDVSSQNLTPQSTELRAQIDPRGAETEYEFQYGTVECAKSSGSCAVAPVPEGEIKPGFGDRAVSVTLHNLQPATAYYYRVLASSAQGGPVEGVPSPTTFTTLPSPSALPDGRAWELVSPVEKHGAAIEAIPPHAKGGIIQAAADGSAIAWLATGPLVSEPQGNRSFEFTQLLSTREAGWGTQSLETPHNKGRGLVIPSPSEYHYFSTDLSKSLVEPTEPANEALGVTEDPPLSPEATEKTMYVRDDPPAAPAYLPLVTSANDTAHNEFGGGLEFLDATRDLKHVVFESKVGLSAAAPSAAGLYEWEAGEPLQLVSVLPDGTPAPDEPGREPSLGDGGGLNAAKRDLERWHAGVLDRAGEEQLYLRDTARGETIRSTRHRATAPPNRAQGDTNCQNPRKNIRKCTSRPPPATARRCSSPTRRG